jgi:NAD(P)-dependent dehydrogenase (short-subunit alcohol dehydrogenase family)
MAAVPGHVDTQTDNELRDNLTTVTLRAVIENLTAAPPAAVMIPEPGPQDVVMDGSFEEINRFFYENGWSDGLPIVPPTTNRVDGMLRAGGQPRHQVLGEAEPLKGVMTVEKVAVNAIMAGVTRTPALSKIPGAEALVAKAVAKNPYERLTQPEDVAEAIVALAKPGTHWINMNVIRIDGGESSSA